MCSDPYTEEILIAIDTNLEIYNNKCINTMIGSYTIYVSLPISTNLSNSGLSTLRITSRVRTRAFG